MPKESNLEFKVGLFMLISLAGLIMFIFSVSDSSVLDKGKGQRMRSEGLGPAGCSESPKRP